MAEKSNPSFFCFLIAFGLINQILFALVICSILYFVNLPISYWQFPCALILSGYFNYVLSKKVFGENYFIYFRNSTLIILTIVSASIVLASYFYDVSFDGQSYHMESVFQLGSKWNPINTELPDTINQSQAIYVNHYPKGAEIPQSSIYCLTGRIESGKASNFILLSAVFSLCMALFYHIGVFSTAKKIWMSALLTLNPVTTGELISYYVDGQLALLLTSTVIVFYLIWRDDRTWHYFLLFSIVVIAINLKFTGVIFICIFFAAMMLLLFIRGKFQVFRRVILIACISVISGIGIIGYHPYVVNAIHYHSPFYPVVGKSQKDIISQVYPESFKNKNTFEKLFVSLFAHTDDLKIYENRNPVIKLKIPFTFNAVDLKNAPKLGVKMAGFGPFFSGSLMLAICLLFFIHRRSTDRRALINLSIILAFLLLSVVIIPEAWWARYVPQLWLFPLIIAFASESMQWSAMIWIRRALYFVLVVNVALSLLNIPWNIIKTSEINYQMAGLEASRDTIQVQFSYFRSNRIRFYENRIPIKEQLLGTANCDSLVHSSTKFQIPPHFQDVQKPRVLKWVDLIKSKGQIK